MRFQIYIIALLMGMIMWVMSFDVARDVYHDGQEAGTLPNLHIHHHLHDLVSDIGRARIL